MSDNQVQAAEAAPATVPANDQTAIAPAVQPADTAVDANTDAKETAESTESKKDECMRALLNCHVRSLIDLRSRQGHQGGQEGAQGPSQVPEVPEEVYLCRRGVQRPRPDPQAGNCAPLQPQRLSAYKLTSI